MSSIYGSAATVTGLVVNVAFVVAVGMGGGPSDAVERATAFFLGGVFVMVYSLVLWPLHQDGPVISAVASAYTALADFLAAESESLGHPLRQRRPPRPGDCHDRQRVVGSRFAAIAVGDRREGRGRRAGRRRPPGTRQTPSRGRERRESHRRLPARPAPRRERHHPRRGRAGQGLPGRERLAGAARIPAAARHGRGRACRRHAEIASVVASGKGEVISRRSIERWPRSKRAGTRRRSPPGHRPLPCRAGRRRRPTGAGDARRPPA